MWHADWQRKQVKCLMSRFPERHTVQLRQCAAPVRPRFGLTTHGAAAAVSGTCAAALRACNTRHHTAAWAVCCCWCLVRLPLVVKPRWHFWQTKGRSPVWVRMCAFKWLRKPKALAQMSQTHGRSPVWMSACLARVLPSANALPQSGQG